MQFRTILGPVALALAGSAFANPSAPPDTASLKTRAEVRAELALWQRAGMDEATRSHTHLSPSEIDRRMAAYLRLRHGPQYQAELQRQNGVTSNLAATSPRAN